MAASVEVEPELADDVVDAMESFHESLGNIEDSLRPLLQNSIDDMKESMGPVECAKLDLVVAYAINSMFWMYLITQGVNPKEHPVKQELDRIKKYMAKVKEAHEKKEASMRIDKDAAKRFVKSALWQPDTGEEKGESSKGQAIEKDKKKEPHVTSEKRKGEGKNESKKKKKKR